jgi:hypothetical protein
MPRPNYGPAVIDGQVQYFSASSLTTGDADSQEGCLRRWWYEKVDGRRPPSTTAQELGTQLHAELEAYLTGAGLQALGPLAARGRPMIPTPGDDLSVEHDLLIAPGSSAVPTLAGAPLRLLGIPVVGYIDLFHGRCTNKGVSDIEDTQDPPGTVEVLDWKTTGNAQYIKTADAMARTVQMTVYGKWVLETHPWVTHVRLSHGYFVTRGSTPPRKVTLRVIPAQIERQWARIERVAGSILEAAKAKNAEQVPANMSACDAYAGCPHRRYCSAESQASFVAFFGPDAADHMLRRLNTVLSTPMNIATHKGLRGLGVKKPEITDEMRAEMVRVAREEVESRYPGLAAQWDELLSYNVGYPAFTGELARVVNELTGALGSTTDIAGTGELAAYGPFSDPVELPDLVQEVKAFVAAPLLPPETPPSDPTLASEAPVPQKKRPGRPPGSKSKVKTYDIQSGQAAEIPSGQVMITYDPPEPLPVTVTVPSGSLHFYVNCKPSCKYDDFWPWVHELISDMNKASGDALDFRLVPQDHKFAFGRWKAAISAALETCSLPPGHYVLDSVGGEIGLSVVEAMRTVVARRGGVFVQ